jgi:succinylglutamate desuccinylase
VPAREIGRVVGRAAGATLVVVAGIHGNEPAGIIGARRVLAALGGIRGELVILAGNVASLRAGARYAERDLNRGWTSAHLARIATSAKERALVDEDREQADLWRAISEVKARARGPLVLADLHTSSAAGVPFVLFRDSDVQRDFVRAFPIPVVSGILEHVVGNLAGFAEEQGFTAFSVEGGQHESPASADALEAIIWLALEQARMIGTGDSTAIATVLSSSRARLNTLRADLPHAVEVISRHAITPEDAFVMERGFRNIDHIKSGQLLAKDARGDVRAHEDGVVVLPLYQKLGADGFFWGRVVA